MKLICLSPKTHKGKNIIAKWGPEWFLIDDEHGSILVASVKEQEKFRPESGIHGLDSARRIMKVDDTNFQIATAGEECNESGSRESVGG